MKNTENNSDNPPFNHDETQESIDYKEYIDYLKKAGFDKEQIRILTPLSVRTGSKKNFTKNEAEELKRHLEILRSKGNFIEETKLSFDIYKSELRDREKNTMRWPKRISADPLIPMINWLPSKSLRKKIKKFLADEIHEIDEFRKQGLENLANWRSIWVYIHLIRYILSEPLNLMLKTVNKMIR